MTVVCDACKTENRDNAMFCRGCAGKLPGFAATGPAALGASKPPAASARPGGASARATAAVEFPRIWLGLGLLFVVLAIAFTGWYAYVTRKVVPPPTQPVAIAPPPGAAPVLPLTLITPVEPPPAPRPATSAVPSASPATPEPAAPQPATPRAERRPVQTAAVTRPSAGDPRSACSHLNFIAAARCEAAQCDRAEYSRHPRCAVVREDRRRDEARRNPLMAN